MTRSVSRTVLALLLAIAPLAAAKDELIPTDRKRRPDEPPNPLREVSGDMGRVARRLTETKTADGTQDMQKAILEKLDDLVDEARKQEQKKQQQKSKSGQSKSRKPRQPQPKPHPKQAGRKEPRPKQQKTAKKQRQPQDRTRPGLGRPGQGHGSGGLHTDAEEWGILPPAIREQLLQTRGEGFPLKYRELLRRYYRELAKPRE